VVPSNRTRGNGHKLKHRNIIGTSEPEEELLYSEGDGALNRLRRGIVESSLETFKTSLDAFLCSLL